MRQVIETTITTYNPSGQVVKVAYIKEEIYDEALFVDGVGARTPAPPRLQTKPRINKEEQEALLPTCENLPLPQNPLLHTSENLPSSEGGSIREECEKVLRVQEEARANRVTPVSTPQPERLLIKFKNKQQQAKATPPLSPIEMEPAPSALHTEEEVKVVTAKPFDLASL